MNLIEFFKQFILRNFGNFNIKSSEYHVIVDMVIIPIDKNYSFQRWRD